MMLKGIWPDFQSQTGDISMTLYYRAYPQGTERTKGPYTLTTNTPKKEFMADGRVFRVRFEGNSAPAFARLGKPAFDAIPTGTQ